MYPTSYDSSPQSRRRKFKVTLLVDSFTFARKKVDGRKVPQAIAHRGYKVKFPENTMGAFQGAVKVGAEAIETDIHLSKDNVVVLSHVSSLLRHPNAQVPNEHRLRIPPSNDALARRAKSSTTIGSTLANSGLSESPSQPCHGYRTY